MEEIMADEHIEGNNLPARMEDEPGVGSQVATVAAIGLGVALIEAELIPGMLIGAAAVLAPKLLPGLGNALRPVVKGVVRAGYSLGNRAKETFAEAGEQLQDIVAEVKAETEPAHSSPAPQA
jgi:hypothetical protein